MQNLFHSKRRWLRWIFLFALAVALAIVLSHTLNRSPLYSHSDALSNSPLSSNESSSITNATASEVRIQSKYDRSLAHYATVSRSDGSFRQMFVNTDKTALRSRFANSSGAVRLLRSGWTNSLRSRNLHSRY